MDTSRKRFGFAFSSPDLACSSRGWSVFGHRFILHFNNLEGIHRFATSKLVSTGRNASELRPKRQASGCLTVPYRRVLGLCRHVSRWKNDDDFNLFKRRRSFLSQKAHFRSSFKNRGLERPSYCKFAGDNLEPPKFHTTSQSKQPCFHNRAAQLSNYNSGEHMLVCGRELSFLICFPQPCLFSFSGCPFLGNLLAYYGQTIWLSGSLDSTFILFAFPELEQ